MRFIILPLVHKEFHVSLVVNNGQLLVLYDRITPAIQKVAYVEYFRRLHWSDTDFRLLRKIASVRARYPSCS